MAFTSLFRVNGVVTRLGRFVLATAALVRALVAVDYLALKAWVVERGHGTALFRSTIKKQVVFTGLQAMPLISVVAVLAGLLLAGLVTLLEADPRLKSFAPFTQTLFTELTVTTFAPMLIALIIIARSGTAIATELAAMQINRETEALDVMGINLYYFVILPRLIGMVLSLVCLAIYFDALMVSTEIAVLQVAGTNMSLNELVLGANIVNLTQAGLKLGIIGVGIATISCYHGLSARRSVTEIPQVATRGVVNCIIFTFVASFAISALFLRLFTPSFAQVRV